MKKLYALLGAAAALLALIFLCLGRYFEISDYDIVSGAAIDREQDGWLVTCEICVPSSDNDFGSACTYVEGRGETIEKAFERVNSASAGQLYTGCCQLYVIGPSAQSERLYEYLLSDSVNLRAVTCLSKGQARDVLKSGKDSENSRAKSLSVAKKVSRYCADSGKPSPKVTEYVKTGKAVVVSETETPVKAVEK